MFRRDQQRSTFIDLWGVEPELGEVLVYGRIPIKLTSIDGDTLHWEEIPWSEA